MERKTITALLLVIITIVISANLFVNAQNSLPFTDVKSTDWFYNDVYLAYGCGLINGKSRDMFAPNDNLKYSEAVKLAACMRIAYFDEEPLEMSGKFWYEVYVDYCKVHGLIDKDYTWDAYATRADFMEIFAAALPDNALDAINAVEDGAIPDVTMYHKNAEAIYKLYRAGIVQGSDSEHRCNPASQVKRSEVAAILTRMMYEYARLEFSMYLEDETDSGGVMTEEDFPEDRNDRNENDSNKTDKNDPVKDDNKKPEKEEDKKPAETEKLKEDKTDILINGKHPKEFTAEDYEKLTPDEKVLFPDYFDTMDEYTDWYKRVVAPSIKDEIDPDIPNTEPDFDLEGKRPEDFTEEDYNNLTPEEKALFPDSFDSMDDYNEWYNRVIAKNETGSDTPNTEPGIDLGGKRPENFTAEDYNNLSPEEKALFPDSFDSMDDYNDWYNKVIAKNEVDTDTPDTVPEVDLNGKRPEDFTRDDYDGLTPEEKALFPDYFESMDDYWEWYNRVIGD